MTDGGRQNVYAWVGGPILGMIAWVLLIFIEVMTCVSVLRDRLDAPAFAPIIFGLLGVSFGGGLLLALVQYELSIEGRGLTFRRRRLFSGLLGMQWAERWIPRDNVLAFRLDKNPWSGQKLTIIMDDGTSIGVPGGTNAGSRLELFVSTFQWFSERDPDHKIPERTDAWLLPERRVLVGAMAVAGGIVSALLVGAAVSTKTSVKPGDLVALAVFAAVFAIASLRFLLKKHQE
jgi:hypothetical protein